MTESKKIPFEVMLAIITFFIGVSVFGLWYFTNLYIKSQQLALNVDSSILFVKPTFENPCDYPQPRYEEIEAEDGVHLAECFIIQNGYTDLPPIADKSKLTPENVFPLIDEEGLKMRHNSLERKAFSYYQSELYGGSWVVMFRIKRHSENKNLYDKKMNNIGRAVTMDFYGRDLFIQHSPYPLISPKAVIINP